MTKVNFFIVGAPKCGTTAMHTYLEAHPDIYMGHKECNFFCTELFDDQNSRHVRLRSEPGFYEKFFAGAAGERIVGESSVFYMCSKEAAYRIRDYNPEARILIQVRNPVDFIASHHSQLLYEGAEDISDVVAAYDAEADRRAGRRIPAGCQMSTILNYREMASFSGQIERFFEAFGRERVLVHLFDDFRADTPAVYCRTLDFLGVDRSFRPSFDVVNPNKQARSRWLRLFLRETPDWLSKASRPFAGAETRRRIRQMINDWNTAYVKREPVDRSFAARVRDDMRPEVERLSALLDRDLTHWLR